MNDGIGAEPFARAAGALLLANPAVPHCFALKSHATHADGDPVPVFLRYADGQWSLTDLGEMDARYTAQRFEPPHFFSSDHFAPLARYGIQ